MSERWTPDGWRGKPAQQVPAYPDAAALEAVETPARRLSAARLRRRGAQAEAGRSPRSPRARRSCCRAAIAPRASPSIRADNIRDFFRVFLQMAVVLTFARPLAGGEGRPHRRPVRQAALGADRDASTASSCRATAATSSTTSSSRPRRARPIRAGSSRPTGSRPRRSTCCAPSPPAAMPTSRTCIAGCWASSRTARSPTRYQELADRITEALDFMRAIGIDPETHPELRADRFLHQPRGAAARLRAGADARRFDHRRLVRDLGPHALDRRPHAPAGPRPCRISAAASRTRSA